jgi:hypothetical protein
MSISSTGLGRDEPLVVSPQRAQQLLDCGNTIFYATILPQLESYKVGKSRKVTVASIREYVETQLAASKAA